MFQFISITYNHEKYIIEHLESIKYQINTYNLTRSKLVICDDFSTDSTLKLIEKWIDKNKNLFSDIKIIKSEINKGIVHNYLKAVDAIDSENFKILAGDDLFYLNSIQDVMNGYEFVATPVITFTSQLNFDVNLRKMKSINSVNKVKKVLKKGNPFPAPGVFIDRKLVKDNLLSMHISNFKWIEDYPSWNYIFNKREEDVNYKSITIPYIMYRSNVGICGNKNDLNKKRELFLLEEEQMFKFYGIKRTKISRWFAKYSNFNNYIIKINKILGIKKKKERFIIEEAREYYSLIKDRADTFLANLHEL